MERKYLLIAAFCLVLVFLFISPSLNLLCGMIGPSNEDNASDNSTPESDASLTILHAVTAINGITPVATYYWGLHMVNDHISNTNDDSDAINSYSSVDDNVQSWAADIKKNYPLNNNRQKGEAVFNYTYGKIVTKWHLHYNTLCPLDSVAQYHEANCAETSRIVYNLCLAVGIPQEEVRYVHSASMHHYWVQVLCDGKWVDIDASHAEDYTYTITSFGKAEPASDVQPLLEEEVT